MSDVIFNVKKNKPKVTKNQKEIYINDFKRHTIQAGLRASGRYASPLDMNPNLVDPAIEGLDGFYDTRLENEYKEAGIN